MIGLYIAVFFLISAGLGFGLGFYVRGGYARGEQMKRDLAVVAECVARDDLKARRFYDRLRFVFGGGHRPSIEPARPIVPPDAGTAARSPGTSKRERCETCKFGVFLTGGGYPIGHCHEPRNGHEDGVTSTQRDLWCELYTKKSKEG